MGLDLGDAVPIGRAVKEILRRAAVDGERRRAGRLDDLGHFDRVDRIRACSRDEFWPSPAPARRPRRPARRSSRSDRDRGADTSRSGLASATCFTGQPKLMSTTLTLQLVSQLGPDRGQRGRVVVPNLHGQRPRLIGDAPQPVGQILLGLLSPQETLGADHLGGLQARAAELAHDLPIGEIRVAGHRRLQHGRIDAPTDRCAAAAPIPHRDGQPAGAYRARLSAAQFRSG